MQHFKILLPFLALILVTTSCQDDTHQSKNESVADLPKLFSDLNPESTNIHFVNEVKDQKDFNVLTYRNYYNGGGVAIGDINNDGLSDLYFTANMAPNKLYLNQGNLQFEEITDQAAVAGTMSWSTGVAMADVNGDGYLDIYVCNSGDVQGEQKKNELFINNGDLTFTESAAKLGLDDSGFSTHASFFDYDQDGDLDMYLLNNSFKDPSRIDFSNIRDQRDALGGDKLFRNDNGIFVDVSESAGIFGSKIGFGLGIAIGDLNRDYLPDIYISNDFWERDYLYLNQGDGTFAEDLPERMSYTSTASMGADIADIDNNGSYDLFSTDMLPATNKRLKSTTVYSNFNLEDLKYRNDYHYQFTQNCLQLNDGNGQFTEIANYAGVAATDWSWASLIFDFDNDGWKDIFVSNGVYHDITDLDFSDFLEDSDAVKQVVTKEGRFDFRDFLPYLPTTPLSNYAFINNRNHRFDNQASSLGLGEPGFSNGSAYGDLDNDGDLDLVVNNVNQTASIYENLTNSRLQNNYLKISFEGEQANKWGIGSSVALYANNQRFYYQNWPIRGFQSSSEPGLTIGLGEIEIIDSLVVVWPNLKSQTFVDLGTNKTHILKESGARLDNKRLRAKTDKEIKSFYQKRTLAEATHKENLFNDFDRERLLPRMLSAEGPGVLVGDFNSDKLEDFILLGGKNQADQVFIQDTEGEFNKTEQEGLESVKDKEHVAGLVIDLNRDGKLDYIATVGGNDASLDTKNYIVRSFFNDGNGVFEQKIMPGFKAVGNISSAELIKLNDKDERAVFLGGRLIPGNYGLSPRNFLLKEYNGQWADMTTQETGQTGMVTDAVAADIDGDGDDDLIIVGEWMPILIYKNQDSKFELLGSVKGSEGMWQSIESGDFNNDGKIDFVLGNWGTNGKLSASPEKPLSMFVNDFDDNQKSEFIINWFAPEDTQSAPFASKMDMTKQMPGLNKVILKNHDYADMTIEDFISEEQLSASNKKLIKTLAHVSLINNGSFDFTMSELPKETQFSLISDFEVLDFDNNGTQDVVLGGNLYGMKPEMGRLDGSKALLLSGKGDGTFRPLDAQESGIFSSGEIRSIESIQLASGKTGLLIGRNNKSIELYEPSN